MTNAPMTLSWLANTAAIDSDRAEQMWNSACDYAQSVTGETQGARYLSVAHQQMVALVERDVLIANPVNDTPWLMIQAHVSVLPLIVANSFVQASIAAQDAISRLTKKLAVCN